jgi:hypothetical protein
MSQDSNAFVVAFLASPDADASDSLAEHERLATGFMRLSKLADTAVSLDLEVKCTLVPAPLVQVCFSAGASDALQCTLDLLATASGLPLVALCESDNGPLWALRSHESPLALHDADDWIVATPERQFYAAELSELLDVATMAIDSLADRASEESVAFAHFSLQHDERFPQHLTLERANPETNPERLWVTTTRRRWIYLEGWRAAQLDLGFCPYDGLMEQAWREGFIEGGGQALPLPPKDAGHDVAAMFDLRDTFRRTAVQLPTRSIFRSGLHVQVDRLPRTANRPGEREKIRGLVHYLDPSIDVDDDRFDEFATAARRLRSCLTAHDR